MGFSIEKMRDKGFQYREDEGCLDFVKDEGR